MGESGLQTPAHFVLFFQVPIRTQSLCQPRPRPRLSGVCAFILCVCVCVLVCLCLCVCAFVCVCSRHNTILHTRLRLLFVHRFMMFCFGRSSQGERCVPVPRPRVLCQPQHHHPLRPRLLHGRPHPGQVRHRQPGARRIQSSRGAGPKGRVTQRPTARTKAAAVTRARWVLTRFVVLLLLLFFGRVHRVHAGSMRMQRRPSPSLPSLSPSPLSLSLSHTHAHTHSLSSPLSLSHSLSLSLPRLQARTTGTASPAQPAPHSIP